jgi:hypothetical protein
MVDLIRKSVDDIAELEVFFRVDSLSTVVRWANEHRKISEEFSLRGRGIGAVSSSGGAVFLPNGFAPPSLEGLEKFSRAVNATEGAQGASTGVGSGDTEPR